MYRLSSIILILFGLIPVLAQSPHGEELIIDCAQCHNQEGWSMDYETLQFDHNETSFQLDGTHAQTDCMSCHDSMIFSEVKSDCMSCHVDIHSQSVGNDCVRCHTSDNWLVFNTNELHEQNGFPLIGVHTNLSCVECHQSESTLIFNPIGNECIECHRDDYLATQAPNHVVSGFSTDCLECHDPMGFGWDSQDIIHDFFPLTLGHDIQDCSQCHIDGNFTNTPTDCFACHDLDYNQTTDPDHQAANLPTDCVSCHTTNPGWMPATLNHDFFPLTLGHDIEDCNQCHIDGNYTNTPTDCFACHELDYNQTTDPDHQAASFPTDCVACHTTNPGWMPATFDHDGMYFPIYSGSHEGEWNECIDCHTNPSNYDVFTCLTCHDLIETNEDHDEVTDYIYESNACFECHPDGSG